MSSSKKELNLDGFESAETSAIIWPDDPNKLIDDLTLFRTHKIQLAMVKYKSKKPLPDDMREHLSGGLVGLRLVDMTPGLNKATKMGEILNMFIKITQTEDSAAQHRELAQYLVSKWKDEDLERKAGLPTDDEPSDRDEEEEESLSTAAAPSTRPRNTTRKPKATREHLSILRRPSPSHPIYGRKGIMYGLLLDSGSRRNYLTDPLYTPGFAKNYGHNGFTIGDWFPRQRVANLRGIHGAPMAGISAGPSGAYSIVVKSGGIYEGLDQDLGDTIWYSGSGSAENLADTPRQTTGTMGLQESVRCRTPVRVLRSSAGAGGPPGPRCGMRYDGLYRVEGSRFAKNKLGGTYEQFKLVRLGNQNPIDHSRPTPQEMRDYDAIEAGY